MEPFKEMGDALMFALVTLLIALPLALWKVFDIVMWLYAHISLDLSWK